MASRPSRRQFLQGSATIGLTAFGTSLGFLPSLPRVSRADSDAVSSLVHFPDHIEPLVRLIEETQREQLIGQVAARIKSRTSYQEVLAALMLAGVRNVQPYPAVGFKFHAVLVINSCHLASLAGPDEDRWLPIFWALDHFKSSQADEARTSGWKMPAVDESRLPSPDAAESEFKEAMDNWDLERADRAIVTLVRTAGATRMFNLLASYAARDFRSIGHKAIYLANSWRTLQVIGWEYAQPIFRSLVAALLNHNGEPNPSQSDLTPDQAWRTHEKLLPLIPAGWKTGQQARDVVTALHEVFRQASPVDAARSASELLNQGAAAQSVWDAVFTGAGELLMRQPGIVGLHGLTTANAMRFLFDQVADDQLRQRLLLQSCSFAANFREAATSRGRVAETTIEVLSPEAVTTDDAGRDEILSAVSSDRMAAARKVLGYAAAGGDPQAFIDSARRMVFLKGNDAHDYKFSSAVLEDFGHVSPDWRNLFLALSVFNLNGAGEATNPLVDQTRAAFA